MEEKGNSSQHQGYTKENEETPERSKLSKLANSKKAPTFNFETQIDSY